MAMKTLSVMKLTGTFLCTLFSTLLWLGNAEAGQVVVRDASEPFDAFAVRDELLRQHEWQELLRSQQQLEILRSYLPYVFLTCALIATFPAMAIFIAPIFTGNSSSI